MVGTCVGFDVTVTVTVGEAVGNRVEASTASSHERIPIMTKAGPAILSEGIKWRRINL
jgi:hypothetical protein